MSDTQRLLRYDPETAVLILANERDNLHLRKEFARVKERHPSADGEMTVVIEGHESTDTGLTSPYSGELRMTYQRLNLATDLGEFTLQIAPPLTVRSAMRHFSQRTGIKIEDGEFLDDIIDEHEYLLRADPDSLRWYGEVKIHLIEQSDYIPDPIDPDPPIDPNPPYVPPAIWEIGPNQDLNGFTPVNPRIDLKTVIQNTVLVGLMYVPPEQVEQDLANVIKNTMMQGLEFGPPN